MTLCIYIYPKRGMVVIISNPPPPLPPNLIESWMDHRATWANLRSCSRGSPVSLLMIEAPNHHLKIPAPS